MIIGVGLDARLGLSLPELDEMGRTAAELGFESIWTPATGVPDAFHVCGQWAEGTAEVLGSGLRSGISVVPAPRWWHPISLAIQAATVSLRSDGNFVLGIGTGGAGAAHFAAGGFPNRPIAVMRDYLLVLKDLLAGKSVDYDGPALNLHAPSLGQDFSPVPVYLAALGPQMLRLAGQVADGVCLNWATPAQITASRTAVANAASEAGRDPSDVLLSMYIRICVDDDVAAARRALAVQVLGYAMVRPGADPTAAYRGHFGRMGFEEELRELEARRDAGTPMSELVDVVSDEMLLAVGYFGPAEGAANAYAKLAEGLDETIVRVITARPGMEAVVETMEVLTPALVRANRVDA